MAVIQLDSMIVTVLRDAREGEHGWDKRCKEKQVQILMADGSTRIVPVSALTVDGVRKDPAPVAAPVVSPKPVQPASPAAPKPAA